MQPPKLSSNAYSINETIEIFCKARNIDKVKYQKITYNYEINKYTNNEF